MQHQEALSKILTNFRELFSELSARDTSFALSDANRIITGAFALAAHGISIGTTVPKTLEVLLFQPSKSQLEYLRRVHNMTTVRHTITENKLSVTITISDKKAPKHLLVYPYDAINYRIQAVSDIHEIMEAEEDDSDLM